MDGDVDVCSHPDNATAATAQREEIPGESFTLYRLFSRGKPDPQYHHQPCVEMFFAHAAAATTIHQSWKNFRVVKIARASFIYSFCKSTEEELQNLT